MNNEMPEPIAESRTSSATGAVIAGYDTPDAEDGNEYLLNDIGVALRLHSERGFN